MPKITLLTEIHTDIKICFDLSRSIDLHKISTAHTNEEAIAGKTSGLITLGESVTWQATHLGFRQKLTSKITAFDFPNYFVDEQTKGIFKSIYHEHHFKQINPKTTLMTDIFDFQSPFWILGNIVNYLFLANYMRKLLVNRNNIIKEFAETDKWKSILK